MSLFDDYRKRGKRNFDHGRSDSEKSIRKCRVGRFLVFCESHGVKNIRDIRQANYDGFMNELRESGATIWTRYKYKLAVHEFAARWHVPLSVKPDRGHMLAKKKTNIDLALQGIHWLSPDQRRELVNIIMRVM
jgi:hypothetical protein